MVGRSVMLIACLMSAPAFGQDATTKAQAADLFDQGRTDMAAGRHAQACPKFEESLRLDKQIGTRLNLANCYEKLGRVASAWAIYAEVVDIAKYPDDRAYAAAAANRLKPRVPRIAIGASTIAGVEAKLDGTIVTLGLPRMVDPGPHTIVFTAPGRTAKSIEVVAVEGQNVPVEVPALEEPTAVPPEPPAPVSTPTPEPPVQPVFAPAPQPIVLERVRPVRGWVGVGVAGVGAIALGVGVWAGLDARSKGDEARALGCQSDLTRCSTAGYPLAEDAYERAGLSTMFLVGGAAAIAAGAILWVTAPARETAARGVAVVPTNGGVDLTFSTRW